MAIHPHGIAGRRALEKRLGANLRELTAEADRLSRVFAEQHDISANEFRALLFVMIAETSHRPLTAGQLRQRMGMSGAAITYIVDRMVAAGHLRRDPDLTDRRRVYLHYGDEGMKVAQKFFSRLAAQQHTALSQVSDGDLEVASRVFDAMVSGMRSFRAEVPVRPRH